MGVVRVVDPRVAAWLRSGRAARGWSVREMAQQIISAASDVGQLDGSGKLDPVSVVRLLYRWEAGKCNISPKYRDLCQRAFAQPHAMPR